MVPNPIPPSSLASTTTSTTTYLSYTNLLLALLPPLLLLKSPFSGSRIDVVTSPSQSDTGDYHAHKKWVTMTCRLPPEAWYKYDLDFWGLDYPPGGALLHAGAICARDEEAGRTEAERTQQLPGFFVISSGCWIFPIS